MNAAKQIVEFCHVLRGLGVRVSTSEMLDSAEALLLEDWADPQHIKAALQATLIKRHEDIPVFRQAFAAFFMERKQQPPPAREQTSGQPVQRRRKADELTFQGHELNISGELRQVYQQMAPQDRQRLCSFLEKTSGGNNVELNFRHVVEKVVVGSLEYWRRQLAAEEEAAFPVRLCGEPIIDQAVEKAARRLEAETQTLLHKDMRRIGEQDLPLVRRLIKQLAKELSSQLSRRYHKTHFAERIDLRRTIRDNTRYGGTMLQLKYKAAKRTKPNILLLCDVSGSMAQYAVFVLQFIYGLASLVDQIESFIFAEDLERMTVKFKKKQPFAELMSEMMAQSGQWGKGTDLSKSLSTLCKDHRKALRPSMVVIIVSDAKTVKSDAAISELAVLKKKVRNIIWLNTLPSSEWSRHKTIGFFQKYSYMVACSTLGDLANIIRSQIFHLKLL
ncbi:VWA domain-containing protein [Anaerospora sp.]|uniref:vWA domain-containing protein n=1 Tax=Anaerospora sp. TaxID=1960278 RepID=UPI0028A0B245|nr:VWA domain-containing protein [Anaerospora sp.]